MKEESSAFCAERCEKVSGFSSCAFTGHRSLGRDKRRYERLVGAADVKVILSDKYYSGCMLRRNEYMEEKADILICYCRKSTGGTAFTVELFKRKNKKIFSV